LHETQKITKLISVDNQSTKWRVYVTYLTNVNIDNNPVDAIGIFKSELQADFTI
jgi:hypothetical protein